MKRRSLSRTPPRRGRASDYLYQEKSSY
jgi:hypothetical protein